ncbi:MAG TPA: immunoglobulin domain-containing protein, partial [Clostridia bacterium]|nr:immunoglobulin domain-containing protein [Clostridia bacterium]
FYYVNGNQTLSSIKFRWAQRAFSANSDHTGRIYTLTNCALQYCQEGLSASGCTIVLHDSTQCGVITPTIAFPGGYFSGYLDAGCAATLGQAVEQPSWPFTTGTNAKWFSQTTNTYLGGGGDAAQSGVITDRQSTYMLSTVTGPGRVSFYWMVSSEQNYDFLKFYIDGVEQARISGAVNWTPVSFPVVSSGTHNLQWTYIKDQSYTNGADAGWVDLVGFEPGPIAPWITNQPANVTMMVGQSATFTVGASGTPPLTFQWYRNNDANPVGANSNVLTLASVQLSDDAEYYVKVSNSAGSVTSSRARLSVNPPASSCTAPSASLVSWWRGELSALDQKGLNHGQWVDSSDYVAGKVNQAFKFNGSSSGYVIVPANASLNVGAGSGFTVETWMRVDTTFQCPLVEWSTNNAFAVHFWVNHPNTGCLYANLTDTNGTHHMIETPAGVISANTLYHVALTYNKSSGLAQLFVNGDLKASQILGTFTPRTSPDLYLGRRPPTAPYGQYTFQGLLDEATLYSQALSAAEILAIYSAGAYGKCIPAAPSILTQPQSQTVNQGSNVTFSVGATGQNPLSYQWRFGTSNILGATSSSYSITNVQPTRAGNYFVVVANAVGSITSSNALLTVNVPPSITNQPQSQTVLLGSNVTFSVGATGTSPLSYQWRFGNSNILGATSSTYTRTNVQTSHAGSYSVVVTNVAGSMTSSNALLTVLDTSDPDYDGIPNWLGGSLQSARLGYWRFNDATFRGEPDIIYSGRPGPVPRSTNNVQSTPSWNVNAVLINSTNVAVLRYNEVEADGTANINCRQGTLRFWFKPDWGGTNAGGVGPQAVATLVCLGTNITAAA